MTRRRCALLLTMSGCGGRKDAPGQRVHIAFTEGASVQLPLRLALGLGYFQEAGLRAVPAGFPGSSKVMEAFAGGSVEVVGTNMEHVIQLAAVGRPARCFAAQFRGFAGNVLVVSPRTSRRIRTLTDLAGATLGVPALGSQTHMVARYLLHREGLKPDSVSTVATGVGATSMAALERGLVDAGFVNHPGYFYLKRKHPDLTAVMDLALASDRYHSSVLCARPEWLANNPDTARRIAHAVLRAMRYLQETAPEEIVKQLPPDLRSPDPSVDLEAVRTLIPRYSRDGLFPDDSLDIVRKVVEVSVEKVRTAQINPRDVFTNEFVKERR